MSKSEAGRELERTSDIPSPKSSTDQGLERDPDLCTEPPVVLSGQSVESGKVRVLGECTGEAGNRRQQRLRSPTTVHAVCTAHAPRTVRGTEAALTRGSYLTLLPLHLRGHLTDSFWPRDTVLVMLQ